MPHVQMIRTDQEHEQALALLMVLDFAPETSEADELDVLIREPIQLKANDP